MKIFKIAALVALTMLIGASIAYAGSGGKGDLDRTRDRLKDGSCLTTVAAAPDRIKAQDRLRLQDGSCLTTVA